MKIVSFLSLLLFASSVWAQTPSPTSARPNIIFIMADDHAYQAISAYSNRLIETPNIDRIAKMGMRFTNATVTNSICAPSRATILTGKHSHLNGKIDNDFPFDTTNVTFPQLFQDAGYQTAMFGKLHFGNAPKGFDQFKILPGQGSYYNPDFITKNEGTVRIEGYVTDIITDMTLDWLQEERNPEEPFLLFYLHKAPHREWLPAERHLEEFTQRTFPEPATLFDDYSGRGRAAKEAEMNLLKHMNWSGDSKIYPSVMRELGIPQTSAWDTMAFSREVGRLTPAQLANWTRSYDKVNAALKESFPSMGEKEKMQWRYQRYMQDYLGTIRAVDENVGRVLDYLEANNLMDNTLIVYTSDQGFYLGEHGWFDKRFVYDESFKTPLLVAWPGKIAPKSTSTTMVQNLDYAQTFLEAAGIPAPADMQGESLLPLLTGHPEAWTRDAVYYHYYEYPAVHMVKRHYAVVTEQYKLVHYYYDTDEWELIDRIKDPQELRNVYDDPTYAPVVAELHRKLEALRKQYGDNSEISQGYLDTYLDRLEKNAAYGSNVEVTKKLLEERKKSKKD
ncbi:MAG: sulfatase [Algoriphagus sp.]|jgi:arylsulfatase A-like enzyme|uniref:sulfatase family protein n=1 Tax=Algoriphagus sp. TaxID=1872435 RepID=UPI002751E64B|nr:sulfatase [Algoriphagus sp.]MDP4748849.1 sulfatase [Algoriphagus sp.]MDP4903834.1 sulfatase [Algoriphagus sp.]MDP4957751.1 sulfatase [Algoriphagus sp.]